MYPRLRACCIAALLALVHFCLLQVLQVLVLPVLVPSRVGQLASTAFAWQLSGWPEGVGGNDAKKKKVGGRDPPPDTPCCWKKWKKDKGKGKGKGKSMGHGAWGMDIQGIEDGECGVWRGAPGWWNAGLGGTRPIQNTAIAKGWKDGKALWGDLARPGRGEHRLPSPSPQDIGLFSAKAGGDGRVGVAVWRIQRRG